MSKLIPLTRGFSAIVDDADFDWLSQFKWCLNSTIEMYAMRCSSKAEQFKPVFMHRIIMNATDGQQVDHINRNKLDNQRSNLRFCSHTGNATNCGLRKDNQSGYKGVSWHKSQRKWQASIRINGGKAYLGLFADKIAAARAYDTAARTHHGDFAFLNFPDEEAA